MNDNQTHFVNEKAAEYHVSNNAIIKQYIDRKTKASDRDSKASPDIS